MLLARELVLPRDAMNYYLGWYLLGAFLTAPRQSPEWTSGPQPASGDAYSAGLDIAHAAHLLS